MVMLSALNLHLSTSSLVASVRGRISFSQKLMPVIMKVLLWNKWRKKKQKETSKIRFT